MDSSVGGLVNRHLAERPALTPRDVYKLLYQGVFGVGHILQAGAEGYLQREASELDLLEHPGETLTEPVSVDGAVIRVNLRPYVRRRLPIQKLYEAMLASQVKGDPEAFLALWDEYVASVRNGEVRMNSAEVEEFNRGVDRVNIKAMHHSPAYRDAYHPAYRVILASQLGEILAPD
jgi:hypothetical protein